MDLNTWLLMANMARQLGDDQLANQIMQFLATIPTREVAND